MIKIIEITFEEYERLADSDECLKTIFLNYIDRETIDRIDWIERMDHIWGLSFILYLKGEEELESEKTN